MRIVLDAMGGDHAPQEVVKGAVRAARAFDCTIVLVGPYAQINEELKHHNTKGLDLPIVDAPEVITMSDQAAQSVRRKPNSSHVVGLRMVRDGEADAFVSAGHSGASMAAALFILGRLKGIDRPAVAGFFPSLTKPVLTLDIGVTTDCKPEYLLQFAQMGSAYAERALGISNPRVALLSNGEESSKGDKLVQEAHQLLRTSGLNFVGNAEPKHLMVHSTCDVLVCDGFVGNMVLKMGEAVVSFAKNKIKTEMRRNLPQRLFIGLLPTIGLTLMAENKYRWLVPAGAVLGSAGLISAGMLPLMHLRRLTDYRAHGGAPLLGVRGVTVIAHGSSDSTAIMNAIRQARDAVEMGVIKGMVDAVNESPEPPSQQTQNSV
jgi:glycerol-3-phosphate acyltransferase PlsX